MAIPNFDPSTYLANKAAQLNRTAYQGRTDWNPDNTAAAIRDAGMTLEEHYQNWGVNEGVSGAAPRQVMTPEEIAAQNEIWTGLINSIRTPTARMRDISSNETVSGQLQRLIAADSPYIQSARNAGLQAANSRGLINSNLAAGTSERAAIDAAAPIAAQDASTYAASGLSAQNANQANAASRYTALLGTVRDSQNLYNTGTLNLQTGDINSMLRQMELDAEQSSTAAKIASSDRASYSSSVGALGQQYQSTILGI